MKKKIISIVLIVSLVMFPLLSYGELGLRSKSAVLMDYNTGEIIYSQNEHEKLEPASITKIMTLLLAMEAIDSGKIRMQDEVVISEYAASMGGTQIYLEAGEVQSIENLIRAATIRSANDAAVALGEAISGSNEAFLKLMNNRAKKLGMKNTHFINATGLPTDNHYTTAFDVSLMSREILKHKALYKYMTTYMEDLLVGRNKDDTQTMVNTNKLIRDYEGITGIKTGSTNAAGYCLSASAMRGELHLIAVIMNAETSNDRFNEAKKLLDYGFANYNSLILGRKGDLISTIPIEKADLRSIELVLERDIYALSKKEGKGDIQKEITIFDNIKAPILKGDKLGEIVISLEGKELDRVGLISMNNVKEAGFLLLLKRTLTNFISSK
ncbi:D-alanyl-D-alanine carboxypeptidase [Tissierella creatinini]|nr:D-alanyl-D-alanine carboxypeptidase [Tissierella creatinini]TJX69105.1 D-alanyl-D-alanine carboxypeptidase [Soehngenia saccharolytica]